MKNLIVKFRIWILQQRKRRLEYENNAVLFCNDACLQEIILTDIKINQLKKRL
jgi:hypothetical protein